MNDLYEDLRVIDLSQGIAGPYAGLLLCQGGADVVKVEPAGGDWARAMGMAREGFTALALAFNTGKRSVAVDAQSADGRAVLARLVRDAILPRPALQGIYHVASAPVSKYALLRHIAAAWGREVEWIVDSSVAIDRTLDASRFRDATGWVAPAWAELVNIMHTHHRLSSGA